MRFPDDVPTLTRGDVTLRAHRLEDAEAIVEQCTDPVSVQWTTVPLSYTRDSAVDWVTKAIPGRWESEKEFLFAIECTHPDGRRRFGGSLSLRDEGDRRAEIAYGAHPAVRGRGVMTTAVNLLLDWGFGERHYETVIWWANRGNFASRRVAWRTGFTLTDGAVPHWLPQRGVYLDGWVGGLHRDDPREPTTPWFDVPRIVGDRVVLRRPRDSDVPRIVEGCSDPRTQYWLAVMPSPYTEADATAYLARVREDLASGQQMQWVVADPETDLLLGNVGLPRLQRDGGEIGYWTHPDARGRGTMQEAVALATRHAFLPVEDGGMGLRRLHIKAAAGNTASQHVAVANGYREYGRERQSERLRDGSYTDLVLFDLLASEFGSEGHGHVGRSAAGSPTR